LEPIGIAHYIPHRRVGLPQSVVHNGNVSHSYRRAWLDAAHRHVNLRDSSPSDNHEFPGETSMGANHAGERKRRKLKNTKKILRTQLKKQAKAK
jgi:hypothetical protein